jgi:hypothetical protein
VLEQFTFQSDMSMRALSDDERRVILLLAEEFKSDKERLQLLSDLGCSEVYPTIPDGSILRFDINGYSRPSGHGRGSYYSKNGGEASGSVKDADGADMEVLLLADANQRVFELEVVRYHPGAVIKPDWSTFRVK